MKAFSCNTLNGDWFEDRAKPLNGVLADYGTREFSTTNKASFVSPSDVKMSKPYVGAGGKRGMIHIKNFKEMEKKRGPTVGKDEWSKKVMLPPPKVFVGETSSGAAYGVGDKPSLVDKKMMTSSRAAPAGMTGMGRSGAGLSGSGATGEVLKEGADPQDNTAAQRSWLYEPDPMFEARRTKRAPIDASYMSLSGVGEHDGEGYKGNPARGQEKHKLPETMSFTKRFGHEL